MRYAIKRGSFGPLLALFGATQDRAFVEVEPERVRLCFGLVDETIPRAEIADAAPASWPVWAGIGWRIATRKRLGLIGSLQGVVELTLRAPRRFTLPWFWPMRFQRVDVSLEDPDAFLRELQAQPA